MFTSLENSRYMQYVAALSATMSVSAGGMYFTWLSPTMHQLTSENSPIGQTLTGEEISWVASTLMLSSIPISPIIPVCLDTFGRKKMLLATAFFYAIGWIFIIFADSLWMLIVARVFGGVGYSIAAIAAVMYNGEISDKDIRGKLGTSFSIMKLSGSFLVLSIGPFVSYTVLAIIGLVVPIIFFCIFFFMPDSPYHLLQIGKKSEARNALQRLAATNASQEMIDQKLEDIQTVLEYDLQNRLGTKAFFTKREYRKSIFLSAGLKTLQQMSGIVAMESYLQLIIASSGSSISPEISSIIFGSVQFPAAMLAAVLVDKMGRKPMLIISALGCTISLAAEGAYFYLQDETDLDIEFLSWLPITALVTFMIMASFGIIGLPYILLGELFASNIKSVAVTVATTYGGLLAFTASKIFDPVVNEWGICAAFWIYGGFCLFGLLFVIFFLPETKGKTFIEIQDKINKRNRKKPITPN